MNVQKNISLSQYSTMGLGGSAAYLAEITNKSELPEALDFAKANKLAVIMVGGGSNTIWQDGGFDGLVLVNKILGYKVSRLETAFQIEVGSGEEWDYVVKKSVEAGLSGIEALSLIPGTAGATPVQNVGAYGQEIAQTLISLEAFDTKTAEFVNIKASDCNFSYRSSRFKTTDKGRFWITSIKLHLHKGNPAPPFYASVQTYFDDHNVSEITPAKLRQAVIDIRNSKLPDPRVVKNCGSFFHNPVVTYDKLEKLSQQISAVPHWPFGKDRVKLSAAWLIDQAGFKDFHDRETGMATWPKQSLVLINEGATSTKDLLAFKQKVVSRVKEKFDITLVQEPQLLPEV